MNNSITRPKSLREAVEEYICKQIANNEWPKGFRLPSINDLCEQLHVSQTTTREAIQRLSTAGLLETHQGLGTFVKQAPGWLRSRPERWQTLLQEDALLEIIEARELLEVQISGLAAKRRTAEDIECLKMAMDGLEKALHSDDYDKYDLALHELIWKSSHNKIFLQMMQAVYSQLEEVIRVVALRTTDIERMLPIHSSVITAIIQGDPDAARSKMQAHFDSVREDVFLAAKQVTNGKE